MGRKKKNIEEIKQAFEKEGYILLSTEYINAHSKLDYICPKGHKHSITWNKFNTGRRCPKCSGQIITFEEVKQAFEKEGYTLLSTEYIKSSSKLKVRCPKGHEYEVGWGHFASGVRCPKCNVSKGEERITLLLEQNNVNYETQKAFKECKNKKALRFDFYLPDYNVCIEYDGIQHHKPVDFGSKGQSYAEEQLKYNQKKDNIKTQYCKDNNIKLIRIPYWEFDNIENILKQELNLE